MIHFIMGITCVGKDELVEHAVKCCPDIGAIQVGKEMRKRHSPEYFKGLGALDETEPETWEIVREQLALCSEKKHIFVTGMPRLKGQVSKFFSLFKIEDCRFWLLHCDEQTIYSRLKIHFKDEPCWANLAEERIENDKIQLYQVITEVLTCSKIIALENSTFFQRDLNVERILRG